MGVCYRLPEQDKEVDEAVYRQLEATSKALVPWFLWGTLTTLTFAGEEIQRRTNSPGGPCKALMTTFWQGSGVSDKKWCDPRFYTNKEGRSCWRCEAGSSLSCSDQEFVDFSNR